MNNKTKLMEVVDTLIDQSKKIGNFSNPQQAEEIRKDCKAMSQVLTPVIHAAKVHAALYLRSGFLPSDQFIVSDDDARLMNAGTLLKMDKKMKVNFLEEFETKKK